MANQTLDLATIENSKIFKTAGGLSYNHPIEYLNPFFEKFKGIDVNWNFQAEIGSVNRNQEDDSENVAYSRLSAIATLPPEYAILAGDSLFNDMTTEVGLVYNLDTGKPEMKLFRGERVRVCLNQCVFGASNITTVNMLSSRVAIYEQADKYVQTIGEMVTKYKGIIEKLTETKRSGKSLEQIFGKMLVEATKNQKLGIQIVTGAIKSILDSKSMYKLDANGEITDWRILNALTEEAKRANIFDAATKVQVLDSIFDIDFEEVK